MNIAPNSKILPITAYKLCGDGRFGWKYFGNEDLRWTSCRESFHIWADG
jgi:hypothetical protein